MVVPEKPEVVTVANKLKPHLLGRKILDCHVYWDHIIAYPDKETFIERIKNQTIHDIQTRGKWLVFTLDHDKLLIHLRMEGKFFFRQGGARGKHEHVIFQLDQEEWRYHDTRKFGKMWLLNPLEEQTCSPLLKLGLEYDDVHLTGDYLYQKIHHRSLPIKTILLDQSIIAGIGNIYDDEILFLSHIAPSTKASRITKKKCQEIVTNTQKTLHRAIELGGTTIRSYTSEEGVHGLFQNELSIHGKQVCPICHGEVKKEFIGGRGTYYCPKCQR